MLICVRVLGGTSVKIMSQAVPPFMIHIGQLIFEEMQRQERTPAWLARKINCERPNVYLQTRIHKHRPSIAHFSRIEPRFLRLLLTRDAGGRIIFIRNSKSCIRNLCKQYSFLAHLCNIVMERRN